jgi:hypothetical protein
MQREKEYIIKKNNYHPKKQWRYIGLLMRCLDGSILKAICNRKILVGKKLQDVYPINYNILSNVKKML